MTTLTNLSGGLFADALSVLGIPANTATNVFRAFMRRRTDEGCDILLGALRAGEIDSLHAANEDEVIAIMYRYLLAVRDGAARRNLRLLAGSALNLSVAVPAGTGVPLRIHSSPSTSFSGSDMKQ